jgi:hypothetical protein
MQLVNRDIIITTALAATMAACGPAAVSDTGSAPPAPRPGAPEGGFVALGGCDQWGCGANTARVESIPIGPLHLDGQRNQNGFTVVPELHKDGVVYQLDIERGEIIGKPRGVATAASGQTIQGLQVAKSWFSLRRGQEKPWQIEIEDVAVVPLWVPRPAGGPMNAGSYEYVFAYRLKIPAAKERYACRSVAWGAAETYPDSSPKSVGGYRVLPWQEEGQYAVLVKGETYDPATATVARQGADGARWFEIACSGAALSKMKLMGYDPEERRTDLSTTPGQRQATLKMITARYCGAQSFTTEGQPLFWQNARNWFAAAFVGLDPGRITGVEAAWSSQGAVCLNKPRSADWTRAKVIKTCGRDIPVCEQGASRPIGTRPDAFTSPKRDQLRPPRRDEWTSLLYE